MNILDNPMPTETVRPTAFNDIITRSLAEPVAHPPDVAYKVSTWARDDAPMEPLSVLDVPHPIVKRTPVRRDDAPGDTVEGRLTDLEAGADEADQLVHDLDHRIEVLEAEGHTRVDDADIDDQRFADLQRSDEAQAVTNADHTRRIEDVEVFARSEAVALTTTQNDVLVLMARVKALEVVPACPPTNWKGDLLRRLSSRKLLAFIGGLGTVVVTAWQTSPDGRFTLAAVVVSVSAYLLAQSREDSAAKKSEGEKATAVAAVQAATVTAAATTATADAQVQSTAMTTGARRPPA